MLTPLLVKCLYPVGLHRCTKNIQLLILIHVSLLAMFLHKGVDHIDSYSEYYAFVLQPP